MVPPLRFVAPPPPSSSSAGVVASTDRPTEGVEVPTTRAEEDVAPAPHAEEESATAPRAGDDVSVGAPAAVAPPRGHVPSGAAEGTFVRFHRGERVRLDHLSGAPGVDSLWGADLVSSSALNPGVLRRPTDRSLISLAMPDDAGESAKVMLLRTMAVIEEYQRFAREGRGELNQMKRLYMKQTEEAAELKKVNLQLSLDLKDVQERLARVSKDKEDLEKEAKSRETELIERVSGAELEVAKGKQALAAVEVEILTLGERARAAVEEVRLVKEAAAEEMKEVKMAALQAEASFKAAEVDFEAKLAEAEVKLAEAYAEYDLDVGLLEDRLEGATKLYDAGFVLGFERARSQVELLVPSFDVRLLERDKVVQEGRLVPDPEGGCGGSGGDQLAGGGEGGQDEQAVAVAGENQQEGDLEAGGEQPRGEVDSSVSEL